MTDNLLLHPKFARGGTGPSTASLKTSNGGGTSGDGVEETSMERRINRLEIGFCAAFVIIVGGAASMYVGLAGKSDAIVERTHNVELSVVRLESRADETDRKLTAMDSKLDHMDSKLNHMSDKLDRVIEQTAKR